LHWLQRKRQSIKLIIAEQQRFFLLSQFFVGSIEPFGIF